MSADTTDLSFLRIHFESIPQLKKVLLFHFRCGCWSNNPKIRQTRPVFVSPGSIALSTWDLHQQLGVQQCIMVVLFGLKPLISAIYLQLK